MECVPDMHSNGIVVVTSFDCPLMFLEPFIESLGGFTNVGVSAFTGYLVDDSNYLVKRSWCFHPSQQRAQC